MRKVDLESIPVGFRFHPTDEELVNHYLKSKTLGLDFNVRVIPEVDICSCEPWELRDDFLLQFRNTCPDLSEIQANDNRWYFFCRRDAKNPNVRNRVSRLTKAGFWKPTGKDRDIKSRDTNALIGKKKTLVYYTGRVRNSQITDWVIHEYQLISDPLHPPKKGFVLCLLKRKKSDNTRVEVETSTVTGPSLNVSAASPIPNSSPQTNHLDSDPLLEFQLDLEYEELIRQSLEAEEGPSYMDFSSNDNGFSNFNHEEMQLQRYTMESIDNSGQYLGSEDDYTLAEWSGHRVIAAGRSEMPETHLVRASSDGSFTEEYVKDSKSSNETDTEAALQLGVDLILESFRSSNKPIEINCRRLTSTEFPVKPQYEVRSHNFVAQGTGSGKILVQEVFRKEPKQGKVRESSGRNQKGESKTALASSHGSSPASDNPFNVVIGTICVGLLVVFVVLDMTHKISSVF